MKNKTAKNYIFNRYLFGGGIALMCIGTVQAKELTMTCTSLPGFTFAKMDNDGEEHVFAIATETLETLSPKEQQSIRQHMRRNYLDTKIIKVTVNTNIEKLTDIIKTSLGGNVKNFLPEGPITYDKLSEINGIHDNIPWKIRKLQENEPGYRPGKWEIAGHPFICTWDDCSTVSKDGGCVAM
jgi:hypothetical protein